MNSIDSEMGWDVSAHPLPDYPNRGQGRDEWLRATAEYLSGWLDSSMRLGELIDAGDDVVKLVLNRGSLVPSTGAKFTGERGGGGHRAVLGLLPQESQHIIEVRKIIRHL